MLYSNIKGITKGRSCVIGALNDREKTLRKRRMSLWHAENYIFFGDFLIAVIGGAGTIFL
jgi:hypothetical protein